MIIRHSMYSTRVATCLPSTYFHRCCVLGSVKALIRRPKSPISHWQPSHLKIRPFSSKSIRCAAAGQHVSEPADLSTAEYHQRSDTYIDSLVESLEEFAERDEAIDVEYHSGVLNLVFPPAGTYVINKQPPNRQIWLSSPISGPKRYDYVVGEGGKGDWIYLRDGSSLTTLLNEELKLDFEPADDG